MDIKRMQMILLSMRMVCDSTYLIRKVLSELGIDFMEYTGRVPVEKRQTLIDEFRDNPDSMVFLSTDAGGVGLNLQNTDCLINFELPWNPAKLNQRIGRIHRIGQKSSSTPASTSTRSSSTPLSKGPPTKLI